MYNTDALFKKKKTNYMKCKELICKWESRLCELGDPSQFYLPESNPIKTVWYKDFH